jgi:hypothetical protein
MFQLIVFGSIDSRPVVRENILAAEAHCGGVLHFIADRKQRERKREAWNKIAPQAHLAPVTYFLKLDPIS